MLHVAKIVSGCQMGSVVRAGNVAYSIKSKPIQHYKHMGLCEDCLHVYIPLIFTFLRSIYVCPIKSNHSCNSISFVSDVVKMSYN